MRIGALLASLLVIASGCIANNQTRTTDDTGDESIGPYTGPALADPLKDGAFSYTMRDYDEGIVKVGGRDNAHKNYSYDARIRGVLFTPQGDGPFPLLLFLHGQHPTCGFAGREAPLAPPMGDCEGPEPWQPYANHRGYDYLAKHLASHGYIVASILAKEINQRNGNPDIGMWARGELVLATIDKFQAAHEGGIDLGLQGKVDMDRIGLMGHSRGGEGVVTATHVNAARDAPHKIGAVIALAPTDFNRRGVEGSALLSLVPNCDGDVFSLHGLRTYDHSRFLDSTHAKVQILVHGANHNNYNTNWGKGEVGPYRDGDDAPPGRHVNPDCDINRDMGGGRLTSDDTQREGLLHMAGFFRWVLGHEYALAPYFTGLAEMPSMACPGKSSSCPDAVLVSATLPGHRIAFNATTDGLQGQNATSVRTEGFESVRPCSFNRCSANVYSSAPSVALTWSVEASVHADLPSGFLNGMDSLAFRAAVPTEGDSNRPGQPVDLSIVLIEENGTRHPVAASEFSRALLHPRGEILEAPRASGSAPPVTLGAAKVSLNMVRVPLTAFGPAATNASAIELVFDKTPSGVILLSELYAQAETRLAVAAE